LRILREWLGHM
jgi:hypothetical protein